MKTIKEIRNHFIQEIDQNELLGNKNKKLFTTLNYIQHFLTLAFAVTICIYISAFASLIDIFKGTMSSKIGLNICTILQGLKSISQ